MCGSRWGWQGVRSPPHPSLKNHKNLGFLAIQVWVPLKNNKATKPAFNVGPSSARQKNAIKWRFAGGPMMAPLIPSSTKKKITCQIWAPSNKTFWIRACSRLRSGKYSSLYHNETVLFYFVERCFFMALKIVLGVFLWASIVEKRNGDLRWKYFFNLQCIIFLHGVILWNQIQMSAWASKYVRALQPLQIKPW